MSIKEKRLVNAYAGTGHEPKDKFTVTHISTATMSALQKPSHELHIKKQTFEIGGTEYEFVIDVSTKSS